MQLRINWHVVVLGTSSRSTALYNRRQRSLKYFSWGNTSDGTPGGEHALYGGVTDAALQKLASNEGGGSLDAGLGLLVSLPGCTKRRLLK